MSSDPLPPTSPGDVPEPILSRRGLLIAGAALIIAGCQRRPGYDGQSPVTTMPPTRPTQPTPPALPPLPQPPAPITGNGYTLVQRAAWTTQSVKGNHEAMGRVTRLTVHHTGEHGNWADLPDIDIIQRIESYHRNNKGWAAIGYHFLVGKDGRVYEGRPAKYQGAHVSTQNENNLGISVIGDFMRQSPSPAQLAALKALLDDKRKEYGVGLSRVYGHRDLHASQCPGDVLYAWVKRYKSGQSA